MKQSESNIDHHRNAGRKREKTQLARPGRKKLRSKNKEVSESASGCQITGDGIAVDKEAEAMARYRILFEQSQDAILVSTPEGTIEEINSAGAAIFGLTPRTVRSQSAADLYMNPADRQAIVRELLLHGSIRNRAVIYRRADGSTFDALINIQILAAPGGTGVRYLSTVRDITEVKRAQDALRESESRLSAVFKSSLVGISVIRLADGQYVDVNDAFLRLFGYTREQALSHTSLQLRTWAFPEGRANVVKMLREKGSVQNVEGLLLKTTGEVWTGLFSAEMIDIAGEPHVLVMLQDVTERKQAEKTIGKMQSLLNETQEITKVGGWEFDVAKARVTWTDEVYRIHGVSKEYDPGNPDQDIAFYAPEDQGQLNVAFYRAVEEGEPYDLELQLVNAAGEKLWVRTIGRVEKNDGKILRVYGNIMDITDRKRAEEEVKRKAEDLSLLNALNAMANRGESLQAIIRLVAEQSKTIFSSLGAALYLPSEDKQYLIMQNLSITSAQVEWIEKLIGSRISDFRIALTEESIYRQICRNGKPKLTNDPEAIQEMIAEFTEDRTLKKLAPGIFKFLGIHSMVTAPIIAGDELIGMLDISRNAPFSEQDVDRIGNIAEELSAILQRKRAEEGIRRAHDELTRLNSHLNKIREDERTHVAREIHDDLGQVLTTVKLDLSLLESKLKPDQTDLIRRCQLMQTLMNDSIASVQRIASQLRPGLLDDLGLGAAIEWQTEEFQSRTGIVCTIKGLSDLHTLRGEARIEVFRIFQEALTNVARHSKATTLDIVLAETNECLVLEIKDNGIGIDNSKIGKSASLGLMGMRERARSVGGSISICSSPGLGTCVKVEVPILQKSPVNPSYILTSDDR